MTKNEEDIINGFIKSIVNHPNRTVVKFPDDEDAHMVIRMNDLAKEINQLVKNLNDAKED